MHNWLKAICTVFGIPIGIVIACVLINLLYTYVIEPYFPFIAIGMILFIIIVLVCAAKDNFDKSQLTQTEYEKLYPFEDV